jgi:hypothetical protein
MGFGSFLKKAINPLNVVRAPAKLAAKVGLPGAKAGLKVFDKTANAMPGARRLNRATAFEGAQASKPRPAPPAPGMAEDAQSIRISDGGGAYGKRGWAGSLRMGR